MEESCLMNIDELAALLKGSVNRQWINVHGPGHSSSDRSLGVRFDPAAPDGFWTNSFADDDPETCRIHIKKLFAKSGQSYVLTDDGISYSKTDHNEAGR